MLGTDMHPSSTISFDSGMDRVPWGRDLITFMTSAAGYMMRTLQKPRKNKPSKRQVNHRRFLHNMIQRKFTEIEAANHQLASALFSVETESHRHLEEHSRDRHQQSVKKNKKGEAQTKPLDENNNIRTLNGRNKSLLVKSSSNNLHNEEIYQLKKDTAEDLNSPEKITKLTCETQQFHWTSVEFADLTPITNTILDDSVCTLLEDIEKATAYPHVQISNSANNEEQQYYNSGLTLFNLSPTSPVSPLSLNSCDFEVQIQPDIDETSQIQHITESLQMDSMENLEFLDTEEYLQHIDQIDLAAVWDIHNEEGLNCLQDSLPIFNVSHKDPVMDKQGTLVNEDICERQQETKTMLENPGRDMNVENYLINNFTYSLEHFDFVGYPNQAKQTRATVDYILNRSEISTTLQNSNAFWEQEDERNLMDQNQDKNWEQDLSYNHAQSKPNCSYYPSSDEKKIIFESGPVLNVNSALSSSVSPSSTSTAHCYGFHTPLYANSKWLRNSFCSSIHKGNQTIHSFEGVAQSFPAPYQNSYSHSVSTPPLNEDWLFSNIS